MLTRLKYSKGVSGIITTEYSWVERPEEKIIDQVERSKSLRTAAKCGGQDFNPSTQEAEDQPGQRGNSRTATAIQRALQDTFN